MLSNKRLKKKFGLSEGQIKYLKETEESASHPEKEVRKTAQDLKNRLKQKEISFCKIAKELVFACYKIAKELVFVWEDILGE